MATKLELSQLLATRNEELCSARLRISILEGELALRPRAQSAIKTVAPRAAWVRPAHLEAARQLAMSSGSVVRV